MQTIKQFIKNELHGWTKPEIIWIILSAVTITAISFYCGDTAIGIISSFTGVMNVICTGKGKPSAYIFGLVNSVLYAVIAYNAMLYGETMLNILYYVPMQFVGFYVWSKNVNSQTNEVAKRRMTLCGKAILSVTIAVLSYAYGLLLHHLGDPMPYIDAFTTVASFITLIITIRRFTEQWIIWIIVDAVSIYMWHCDYVSGSGNIATLLMWVMFLINGIIMFIRWSRESRSAQNQVL